MSAYPVSRMRAVAGQRARTWASRAAPSMPGMRMSLTTTSTGCCSSTAMASAPLPACSTLQSSARSTRLRADRMLGSSSTHSTVQGSAGGAGGWLGAGAAASAGISGVLSVSMAAKRVRGWAVLVRALARRQAAGWVAASSCLMGSVTLKRVPTPSSLCTSMRPLCFCTIP